MLPPVLALRASLCPRAFCNNNNKRLLNEGKYVKGVPSIAARKARGLEVQIRLDWMGPGDSKLLCGPTTIIEGKEGCDRKGRKRARKVQS